MARLRSRQKARLQSAQVRVWLCSSRAGRRWGWEDGEEEGGGLRAMMVELLKQMHLQKEVAVERAARVVGRRMERSGRRRARKGRIFGRIGEDLLFKNGLRL
jgi:hypothetical protein